MAMDMKLQPSDTAPHASWLVLAQRDNSIMHYRGRSERHAAGRINKAESTAQNSNSA
ncbi:Hypothetical protein SMAX5B_007811 [Scophthalmus maximus]|uniref:Uncharacterized protein n=1 Tax=Scophthalmus maximus TaxID=52904 RepID=A0A2U9B2L9_SCOMX|nr:Hypothetical protein SMAX5B_007811 [Scophthalmus maximus]